MTYSLRKWAEGETTGLQLHVVDERGRTVFSTPSFDAAVTERDRLNAGGSEPVPYHRGNRREIRQPDGTVHVEITPEEIRPYY